MMFHRKINSIIALFLMGASSLLYAEKAAEKNPVITHADAAVILAKYTGLFDRYVSEKATLDECVVFLNQTGIYFGLTEIINGEEFTLDDCARVMGQIELIFTGEAEYLAGKVILPKNIATWECFCIMTGVDYRKGYWSMCHTLQFVIQYLGN